jgi:hypothetical protein
MALYYRTQRWPDLAKAYMKLEGEDAWSAADLR